MVLSKNFRILAHEEGGGLAVQRRDTGVVLLLQSDGAISEIGERERERERERKLLLGTQGEVVDACFIV